MAYLDIVRISFHLSINAWHDKAKTRSLSIQFNNYQVQSLLVNRIRFVESDKDSKGMSYIQAMHSHFQIFYRLSTFNNFMNALFKWADDSGFY